MKSIFFCASSLGDTTEEENRELVDRRNGKAERVSGNEFDFVELEDSTSQKSAASSSFLRYDRFFLPWSPTFAGDYSVRPF